jgi:hemoglobin
MRHAEFHIDSKAHDAWLLCMKDAVNGLEISDDLKAELWEYLEAAAAAMVNAPEVI